METENQRHTKCTSAGLFSEKSYVPLTEAELLNLYENNLEGCLDDEDKDEDKNKDLLNFRDIPYWCTARMVKRTPKKAAEKKADDAAIEAVPDANETVSVPITEEVSTEDIAEETVTENPLLDGDEDSEVDKSVETSGSIIANLGETSTSVFKLKKIREDDDVVPLDTDVEATETVDVTEKENAEVEEKPEEMNITSVETANEMATATEKAEEEEEKEEKLEPEKMKVSELRNHLKVRLN